MIVDVPSAGAGWSRRHPKAARLSGAGLIGRSDSDPDLSV